MGLSTPKRDFLPSQGRDGITRALDESYERGFDLGRRAGLNAAADYCRANPDATLQDLIGVFTNMKYQNA